MGKYHQIFLYAPAGPDVEGAKLVECLTNDERTETFGKDDEHRLPAWPSDAQAKLFNERVIAALGHFWQPQDLILLSGGRTHQPIKAALPQALCCEPFVGYEGLLTTFCAFESYAWMHYIYGKYKIENIRWFDTVIYPYADPSEFPHLNSGNGEYLAFLGRRIERKGLHVACNIAKAVQMPLLVAGAGDMVVDNPGTEVRYLGPLDVGARARFLSDARAVIMPTIYCEPGGNVAIEAMMCGTPVVCPDFGVLSETVKDRCTGFHFRVLGEAVEAIRSTGILDPWVIRSYAHQYFSLHAAQAKFDTWFGRLQSLWGNGWYAVDKSG